MDKRLLRRMIAVVLAFLVLFEPIAIQVIKAESLPEPTIINEEVGLMDTSDILAPHDYLDAMLDFRGRNRKEVELRAWGEWQALINSAYLVIDEGATDVFGIYEALTTLKTVKGTACDVGDIIGEVSKYAHMAAAFLAKIRRKHPASTALTCWARMHQWTGKCVELCKNSKTLNFLSFCCPPSSWHNVENTAKGMDQYWRWVQQKGGKDINTELSNAQGVARSIGIGFAVLGTVLAAWHYSSNEDRSVDRWSYNRVKDLVSVGLSVAGIIAMFCIPVVGQVLAIVAAVWGVITYVGNLIGEYNKKWKNAYKNSFWYLYENDPAFKVYYDNRELLKNDEKSSCLLNVDKKYGDFKVASACYDDSEEGRNGRIYIALEKQGVLSSYYNRSCFKLPDFDIDKFMEIWGAKASYMAWKPTEAEANNKKGFWDKVGAVFNPKTYIGWVADKVGSRGYNKIVENEDFQKVYFNPDYLLTKKYQFYITANKLSDPFHRSLGLRIEQSPFNYIPLVGMELKDWNFEVLKEAFLADAFFVGQKEMVAVHNQIERTTQGLDKFVEEADRIVRRIDKGQLPHAVKVREFLDEFAEAYSKNPNKANNKLFRKARKLMEFEWKDSDKKTPSKLLEACRENIEKSLYYDPLSISQKAAEMVLLTITIKQHIDMAAIMNSYLEGKKSVLASFDRDFKNKDINKYLKEGSFLNIKGDGFLDWLAELYSSYEESEKTLKLMERNIGKYNSLAAKSASDSRKTWIIFNKSVVTPPELVEKINKELELWKDTIEAWERISLEANVRVVLAEDKEFAEKVLSPFDVSEFKLESLDPADESVATVDLTHCPADSAKIEGVANVLLPEE